MRKPITRFRQCLCPPKVFSGDSKVCSKCHRDLPVREFFRSSTGGPRSRCKKCHGRESSLGRKKFAERHPDLELKRRRKTHAKHRFGLTLEEYEDLLKKAGPLCQICGRLEWYKGRTGLCLDHCHKTGQIRGGLCRRCNSLIGSAEDNPELLESAANYLRKAKAKALDYGGTTE